MCESLPLCGFQDLFVDHEQALLTPPCLTGFSLHQRIIHGNHVSSSHAHPWEPHTSMSMGILHHTIIQHHQQYSFVGLFFFSPRSLCVGHLGFLYLSLVGTMNTSPPLPHTIMSSDTTCWGDKYHGKLSRVINMTYKNTF